MTKVSIIVPVYNVENYLERCLQSLVKQTLKDIEIICINDGSTDNSKNILEQYAKEDNRIILINQENSGVSKARNKGLELAKGEYIGFIDSDDWVDLNFFEELYNKAKSTNSDIAASSIIREKRGKQEDYYVFYDSYSADNFEEKLKICDIPNYNYIWNKIYKTSKLKQANLNFEEGITYEDIIFTPQVVYHLEKLVTVPCVYYHYFCRKNSIVHTKNNVPDYKKAMDFALSFLKSKNIDIDSFLPKTKRLKIFNFTIFRKTKRLKNKYAKTRFD